MHGIPINVLSFFLRINIRMATTIVLTVVPRYSKVTTHYAMTQLAASPRDTLHT